MSLETPPSKTSKEVDNYSNQMILMQIMPASLIESKINNLACSLIGLDTIVIQINM